ncbi:MAG TPA: hypothetical protein VHH33_06360 [Nitrososphaeraceae archaeon]|jgi:hypothetical protein|nr:hypothetical protein [Nitrososphaeraceae archaeon]
MSSKVQKLREAIELQSKGGNIYVAEILTEELKKILSEIPEYWKSEEVQEQC